MEATAPSEWELKPRLDGRPFSPAVEALALQHAALRLLQIDCVNSFEDAVQALSSRLTEGRRNGVLRAALRHLRTDHGSEASSDSSCEIVNSLRSLVGRLAPTGAAADPRTLRPRGRKSESDESRSVPPQLSDARLARLPKAIPTVDLTRGHGDDAGRQALDVSHLTMKTRNGDVRLPLIIDYHTCGGISTTSLDATIITDCSSVGGILYAHVMYVFERSSSRPLLVIAAESNAAFQELFPDSDPEEQPLFLGLFDPFGRKNLGASSELHELDAFISKAREVVTKLTGDTSFAEAEFQDAFPSIQEVLAEGKRHRNQTCYCDALNTFESAIPSLRASSYRLSLADALLSTAVCHCEQGMHHLARAALQEALEGLEKLGGHPDDIAAILLEIARTEYLAGDRSAAISACSRAIELKLTPHPRSFRSGFAVYEEMTNRDLDGEFLLLGHLHAEDGRTDSARELLTPGLSACRANCDSELEAWALHGLAVVSAELRNWRDAAGYFVEYIRTRREMADVSGTWAMLAIMSIAWSQLEESDLEASEDVLERMRRTI